MRNDRVGNRIHEDGRQIEQRHGKGGIVPIRGGCCFLCHSGGLQQALDQRGVDHIRQTHDGRADRYRHGNRGKGGKNPPIGLGRRAVRRGSLLMDTACDHEAEHPERGTDGQTGYGIGGRNGGGKSA